MRVLFWGTPAFAVPALEALLRSSHTIVGLVTRPDRPRARSRRPEAPPVKRHLLGAGRTLPILQPEKPVGAEFLERIAELKPDVSVVAAYGSLLPGPVLALPALGSLNLHASLLPRHRGATPVAAAILADDAVTGITLMRMDRGLDTGPILLRRELPIGEHESCGELTERLAHLAAGVLMDGLTRLGEGSLRAVPQNDEEATYAPRITPTDAHVRWAEAAGQIARILRAYDPWPGAFTLLEGRRVRLFRGRVVQEDDWQTPAVTKPGDVIAGPAPGLFVRTGEGTLEILELQLEGRSRMRASEFLKGRPIEPGSRLE